MRITANVFALAKAGDSKFVSPEPMLNWKNNVEVNYKKPNHWSPARTEADSETMPMIDSPAPAFANALCVSSEAVFVMRVGLSMGEVEQPSPSNRLHAASW